ncbi:MAG: tRNA lysidine(34) synthetase TilS [Bacteroidota bacterium]|nr:tRNA lysidine(34) synthetase TilS [Bacteroidota bacterium]
MYQRFEAHLSRLLNNNPPNELLVAVSGGVDSMVLLHLLERFNIKLSVAHCNFQLRSTESDEDELFVEKYCQQHCIRFFSKKFDTIDYAQTHQVSIQMGARALRYKWFESLQNAHQIPCLATAHHLDDSIETFFINLSRGTGIDGLLGISNSEKTIRPLLIFSKDEIIGYAQQHQLSWREDSSNHTDKYLRNSIRHNIVPKLKELNPAFLQTFQKSISHLSQMNDFANEALRNIISTITTDTQQSIVLDIEQLLTYHNYQYILYHWLSPYQFTAWEDIYNLPHTHTGKQIFSPTHALLKNRNQLILYPIQHEQETFWIDSLEENIEKPIKLKFTEVFDIEYINNKNIIYVDKNILKFPIIVGKYQESDYFYPFGMQNQKKKVSKYYKDEKLSLLDKQNTWILKSDNQIVWIIGRRQDERFKVTEQTKHIIKIEYSL